MVTTSSVAGEAPGSIQNNCEKVRAKQPKKTTYDAWDSPGVVTTDIEIDRQGNKYVSGYISDEADFDYRSSYQTVGAEGYGFQFVAKFDPQTNFLWIRCLREMYLNHWYKGSTIEVDDRGDLYLCDTTLQKFEPSGKDQWTATSLTWTKDESTDVTRSCFVSGDGYSIVTGVDNTVLVSPSGKIVWQKDLGWNSSATFLENGNIALASNSSLTVVNRSGKIVWQNNRKQRTDIGPEGLTDGGNSYPTDQTGLISDSKHLVIATTINKKTDFDPTQQELNLQSHWIQDAVVAQYTYSGILQWAKKIAIPGLGKTTNRYIEIFDAEVDRSGQIVVLGGGSAPAGDEPPKLFLVKFSREGEQVRFLWLDEYTNFIHNLGRHLAVDSRNRLYATSEGLTIPPFVLSRDL